MNTVLCLIQIGCDDDDGHSSLKTAEMKKLTLKFNVSWICHNTRKNSPEKRKKIEKASIANPLEVFVNFPR